MGTQNLPSPSPKSNLSGSDLENLRRFENIPQTLKDRPQWLAWCRHSRNGEKPTKTPINAKTGNVGKSNDPRTWANYQTALEFFKRRGTCRVREGDGPPFEYEPAGIGFAFAEGDGLTGIDLDHCFENGKPNAKAAEILSRFKGTYCEVSPSGEGIRIFCKGKPKRCGKGHAEKWVELYDHTSPRYLTVTSDPLPDTADEITDQQAALDWLHSKYFADRTPPKADRPTITTAPLDDVSKAARALQRLAPWRCGDYEAWVQVGMSLFDLGNVGLSLWDEWSRASEKYDSGLCERKWRSFGGRDGLTLASLFKWANDDDPAGRYDQRRTVSRPTDRPHGPPPTEPAPSQRARLKLMSAAEVEALPPVEMLLPEIAIPKNDLVLMYGPPGAGKSFVALDIAATVAQFAPVVVVQAEAINVCSTRLPAWRRHHKLPLDRLCFCPQPVDLLNPDAVAEFISEIGDVKPALVVFDTLSRCMTDSEENNADMGRAVDAADMIRRATGATVLLLHHPVKNTDIERGGGALRAGMHTVISLTSEDGLITVKCSKNRSGRDFAPLHFRIIEAGLPDLPVLVRASKIDMRTAKLTQRQKEVLRMLAESATEKTRFEEICKTFPAINRGTLHRTVGRLLELGLTARNKGIFTVTDEGRWTLESEDEQEDRASASTTAGTLNWNVAGELHPSCEETARQPGKTPPFVAPSENPEIAGNAPELHPSCTRVAPELPHDVASIVALLPVLPPPFKGATGNTTGNQADDDDSATESLRMREAVEFVERERRDMRTDDAIRERAVQFGIRRTDLKRAFEVVSAGKETDGKQTGTTAPTDDGGNEKAATGGRKRVRI